MTRVSALGSIRLARVPGRLNLQDVSKDGRLLVTREDARIGMMALAPGESAERDLSWLKAGQTLEVVVPSATDKIYMAEIKMRGTKSFADADFDMMTGSTTG